MSIIISRERLVSITKDKQLKTFNRIIFSLQNSQMSACLPFLEIMGM